MSGKNLFLTNKENEISSKYLDQGYVVEPAASLSALSWIRKNFIFIIR